MNFVQSFITNISFPTSLEELYKYVHLFDIEKVLGCSYSDFIDDYDKYNDSTYESRGVCWTAPKWCKKGDIVFFMHSKTANAKIRKLRKELLNKRESLSSNYFWTMMNALIRADKLHNTYGGKIFAIGKVSGKIINDPNSLTVIHSIGNQASTHLLTPFSYLNILLTFPNSTLKSWFQGRAP